MTSSTQQGTLAVVSQTGESITFFDLPSGNTIKKIENLTSEPHELCHDPKRNLLYMTHAYRHGNYWNHGDEGHEISIVDLSTKTVTKIIDILPAKGPHGVYIDHQNDILYATVEVLPNKPGGGIIGIDLNTHQTIRSVPSDYRTHWFVMTPDGKKAYCGNKTAPFISVCDLENEVMLGKIEVPSTEEPSISIDGRFAYFPTPGFQWGKNPANPQIEVIDTTTDTIVKSIKLRHGALPVHVSTRGDIIVGQYIYGDSSKGEKNSCQISIYDGESHELKGTAPIGLIPLTIRSSADGKTAFSANIADGTVTVVDVDSKTVVRTIEVDTNRRAEKGVHVGAHGMAFMAT